MSILNGLIRKMSGSVGDFTFKRVNGQTVVSEKVTEITNPRTDAQMQVRTKFVNIVSMYRGIRPLINYGFESKAQGVSDYNMFVKVNMQQTPVYLTKAQVSGGACVAAPYQLTQGSLPAIVTSGSGNSTLTDIALGSLDITATTTVAQFAKAVVENNDEFKYGDQISYFTILQKVNETTGIPYCVFKAYAVVLDAADDNKLWDVVLKNGFTANGGKLGHGDLEGDGVFCWVHSRKSSGKTLVSSQVLIDNNSKLADYTGDSAYTTASSSYGTAKEVFLSPDGTADSSTVSSDSGSGSSTGGSL